MLNEAGANVPEGRYNEGSSRSVGSRREGILLTTNLRVQTEGKDVGGGNKSRLSVMTTRDRPGERDISLEAEKSQPWT